MKEMKHAIVLVLFTLCSCSSDRDTTSPLMTGKRDGNVSLPPSAAKRIIESQPQFDHVTGVQRVAHVQLQDSDLLVVSLSIAKTVGWESVYHTSFILKKAKQHSDWQESEICCENLGGLNPATLNGMRWSDIERFTVPVQELTKEEKAEIGKAIKNGTIK